MICPKCKEEGKKSIVYSRGGFSTLAGHMPYYDEDGNYHSHDPNNHSYSYDCSNGHRITYIASNKCANCDYGHEGKTTVE